LMLLFSHPSGASRPNNDGGWRGANVSFGHLRTIAAALGAGRKKVSDLHGSSSTTCGCAGLRLELRATSSAMPGLIPSIADI
jgi:hypothetical protein